HTRSKRDLEFRRVLFRSVQTLKVLGKEGKLVILVNGSPSALVLPALFAENFECLDDYATTAFFSSFLRVLKYAAFYLTVFLPGEIGRASCREAEWERVGC